MSREIDERVVEMRFDNKQFESATKESLGTLARLKEALNFTGATKSLDDLSKASRDVQLGVIASGVDQLTKRFSTFGLVGMRVINNLTDSIQGKLTRGITSITDSIISGGKRRAMNLENAHFQLQSIIGDEERVQAVMNAANDSVTGTAYSFDVAAKAASQFTASGVTDIGSLSRALNAVAGTAATFSADYEQLALVFTQVAGKGRLMGDELLQLSSRGANAAATIADFFNGVNDGTINTSGNISAMVKEISGGMRVTEGDIRDFVSKGRINFDLFAESMNHAFGDSAKKANNTFTGALSNIKAALARIGAGFYSPLVEQNSKIVELFNNVRERVNDVKSALVFDKERNNVAALSKQVTDSILNVAGALSKWVGNLNLTKPLRLFYDWVEIIKNTFKAFYSVLKPVGQALKEVFGGFSLDPIIKFSEGLNSVIRGLRLSGEASEFVKNVFVTLFNVIKTLIGIVGSLASAIFSVNSPVRLLADLLVGLAGIIARNAASFTKFINQSGIVEKVIKAISGAVIVATSKLSSLIDEVVKFAKETEFLPKIEKIFESLLTTFKNIGDRGVPSISGIAGAVKQFAYNAKDMFPKSLSDAAKLFTDLIEKLKSAIDGLSFKKPAKEIKDYGVDLDNVNIQMAGFNTGIGDLIKLSSNINLKDAFDFSDPENKIKSFMDTVGNFSSWLKNTLTKLFSDVTIGDLISGAVGGSIIYSFVKAGKALATFSESISSLSEPLKAIGTSIASVAKSIANLPRQFEQLFSGINKAIKAYQNNLNASAIIKIAGAIAILAASIGLLSLLDTKKVMEAAKAVALVAAVLLGGVTILKKVSQVGKTATDALSDFVSGLNNALMKFAKAQTMKASAKAMQSFAVAIGVIAAAIVGIALMYEKDKKALAVGVIAINAIAGSIIGVMGVMSVLGNVLDRGMQAFNRAATGVRSLAIALFATVAALKMLFNLHLPLDTFIKIGLLELMFINLGAMVIALGVAGAISGEGKLAAGSVLTMAVALLATVQALKNLFKIELPSDWKTKMKILTSIFNNLELLMLVIAASARIAGGAIKATGTILSICVFVGTAVAALMVLSIIPGPKLIKGAVALSAVLFTLGTALSGAGSIVKPEAIKSIYAMVAMIGVIVVAFSALSMLSVPDLIKSGTALGAALFVLAKDLNATAKICNDKAWAAVLAMVVNVAAIAASLYKLSEQPWDRLLAAGTAMSEVLLSVSVAIAIMSKINLGADDIGTFAGVLVALIGVTALLNELAKNPWENLLAAGTAIGEVLLSMSAAMVILTAVGNFAAAAATGMALLDIFIADLAAVFLALGALTQDPKIQFLIDTGIQALIKLGEGLGDFIGSIVNNAMLKATSGMPQVGQNLSDFANNAKVFIDTSKEINNAVLTGVKTLAQSIIAISAANVIDGISKFITGGRDFVFFGQQLKTFGPLFKSYADSVSTINPDVVTASATAAQSLVEVATRIPKFGGIISFFEGESTMVFFGKQLVAFGNYMNKYSENIANLNPKVVTASADAAQALVEVATRIPKTGGLESIFSGNNSIDKFGEKLVSFGLSMAAYYRSVADIKTAQLSAVIVEVEKIIKLSSLANAMDTTGLSKFGKALKTMADNGIKEFIIAFQNGEEKVLAEIRKFIDAIAKAFTGSEQTLRRSGETVIGQFAKGAKSALNQSTRELNSEMNKSAKHSIDGFVSGISKNMKSVTNAAKNLGASFLKSFRNEVGEHSPWSTMIASGRYACTGMAGGIADGMGEVQSMAARLGQEVTSTTIANIDLDAIYSVYPGALTDRLMNTAKTLVETNKKIVMDGGRTQKKLAAIRTADVISAKSAGSAKKEVKEEIIQEEESYWSRLLEVKKAGAEAEKYQDMTTKEFRDQVLDETVNTLKEYTDTLESTTNSIMNQIGLFDEVSEKEALTADELMDNLQAQIDAYEEYVFLLGSLNERLDGTQLGEYLKTLGVDSIDQLREINNMTDFELDQYAGLYDTKMAAATEAAKIQLSSLQTETEQKLADIFGGMKTSVDLFDFSASFDGSIASLESYVGRIHTIFDVATKDFEGYGTTIGNTIVTGVNSGITGNVETKIVQPLSDAIKSIGENQGAQAEESGKTVGKGITTGIGTGMQEAIGDTQGNASNVIDAIEGYLKSSAEINSPSARIARSVGIFLTQGIGTGMENGVTDLKITCEGIIGNIISAFEGKFGKLFDSGVDVANKVTEGIKSRDGEFTTRGEKSELAYTQGIKNEYDTADTVTTTMVNNLLAILFDNIKNFFDRGDTSAQEYVRGISEQETNAGNAGTTVASAALGAIEKIVGDFYTKGLNAASGFISAIESMIDEAYAAGAALAEAASDGVDDTLDINSPSKVMMMKGMYTGLGYLKGFVPYIQKGAEAGRALGDETAKGLSSTLSDINSIVNLELNEDPIITPIVDLSNVESSARTVRDLFNQSIQMNATNANMAAGSMIARKAATSTEANPEQKPDSKGVVLEFTQNNYSPKELSRIDIYRQTRNQLSLAKGALENL